jgi:DNA-binding NtrC family response regulator
MVEDDLSLAATVSKFLQRRGYDVCEAVKCQEAEGLFRARRPDVVLTDYQLPDGTGIELLGKLKTIDGAVPVVLLTGHGSIDLAVEAIKQGAEQFLTKPVDLVALDAVLRRLAEARQARERQLALGEREARSVPDPFAGESAAIRELRDQAQRIAGAQGPVLLLGETGAGKGVLARWLHVQGARARERFVDLNCAGLARELLESELFGHERGAFTGAQAAKPGLMELADKGTLFLDEIGDMDPSVQPRLLKAIEEQRFRRLGDVKDRAVDVRIIAATHHDLEEAVRTKQFRGDLYYRLSVLPMRVPALRERPEDVPALARAMLATGFELSAEAEGALQAYPWPGNVRELRNVLERAKVLSRSRVLEPADLRLTGAASAETVPVTLDEMERRHIERVLSSEGGKVGRAAAVLGIARSSLYEKLKRYRIAAPDEPE